MKSQSLNYYCIAYFHCRSGLVCLHVHICMYVRMYVCMHIIICISLCRRKEGAASSVDAQGRDADVSAALGQSDNGVC